MSQIRLLWVMLIVRGRCASVRSEIHQATSCSCYHVKHGHCQTVHPFFDLVVSGI